MQRSVPTQRRPPRGGAPLGVTQATLSARLEEVLPRKDKLEEAFYGGLRRIELQLADFGRGHDGARGNDEGSGHDS